LGKREGWGKRGGGEVEVEVLKVVVLEGEKGNAVRRSKKKRRRGSTWREGGRQRRMGRHEVEVQMKVDGARVP
jgi:hypothetical protein